MSELLVLGGENAGKSLFVRRVQEYAVSSGWDCTLSSEATQPTVGVEIHELCIRSTKQLVSMREIGSALSSQWVKYIPQCSHIIFLIDTSDMGHLSSAPVLLHEVLHDALGKRVLIAFNKLDLVDKFSYIAANNFFRIEEITRNNPNVAVVYGSCMDSSLCSSVIMWITAQGTT